MVDLLLHFAAPAAGLDLIVAGAPGLCREAQLRHALAPGSAAALAQGLLGALLLAAAEGGQPDQARVDLQLQCGGPLRGFFVDADGEGRVRGMVRAVGLELPRSPLPGRVEVSSLLSGAPGELGVLSVMRRERGGGQGVHRALVALAGADLGLTLTSFLEGDREEGGHAVLEVLAADDQPLLAAAGVLVRARDASFREAARRLAADLRGGGLLSLLVQAPGANAHALARAAGARAQLGTLQLLSEVRPRFACRCSRERLVAALGTIGVKELVDMADKDGGASATCDFCAAVYQVSRDELLALASGG